MEYAAIFGVPRSGTSWLGQIFNSSPGVEFRFQPLFSYAFKERINENSSGDDIINFYNDLMLTTDDFVLQKRNISGGLNPQFLKHEITHLVWKEVRYLNIIPNLLNNSKTKVIGIIRNPVAVLHSWYNAPKEFNQSWDIAEEWRSASKKNNNNVFEYYGFDKWVEATRRFDLYEKSYPDRFKIIIYEDLVENAIKESKALFDFLNLPFLKYSELFVKSSQSFDDKDPYGVFKIKNSNSILYDDIPDFIIKTIGDEINADSVLKKYVRSMI